MNSKILDSIFHGALKPWLISFEENALKEIVKNTRKSSIVSFQDNLARLKTLLCFTPELLPSVSTLPNEPLMQLSYGCTMPEPITIPQHYYKLLMDAGVINYFNATLNNPFIQDYALDVPYQIGDKCLKGIAVLANEVNNEIAALEPDSKDTTYFALNYLRNNLLVLYFSIQDTFEDNLTDVFDSLEDFYLYKMDNNSDIIELKQLSIGNNGSMNTINKTLPITPPPLTFGGKQANRNNLQALFDDLCVDITFLDEEKTSVSTLVDLLLAKEIEPGSVNIYLACQTTEFVLVMDTIGKRFTKLTQTNIEKSKCFWTKEEHNKPPSLITSSNYSKSRSKSKMKDEKKKEILDTIHKYLP
jgi:hypothetical protein